MGRIVEPQLQSLVDQWSEAILQELDRIGRLMWQSVKEKRGILNRQKEVIPFLLEGPRQRGERVCWALSHVRRPSTFGDTGKLSQGEREYWVVALQPGSPPGLTVEGQETIRLALIRDDELAGALNRAVSSGPKIETFYGNKGPLSHP